MSQKHSWVRQLLRFALMGLMLAQSAHAASVHLTLNAYKDEYFPVPSTEFKGEHRLDGTFSLSTDRTRVEDYSFTSAGLAFVADVGWYPSATNAMATVFHDTSRGIWEAFFYRTTDVTLDNSRPNSQHLWIVWTDDGELVTAPINGSPITEWYELGGPDRDYVRHGNVIRAAFSIPEPEVLPLLLAAGLVACLTSLRKRA